MRGGFVHQDRPVELAQCVGVGVGVQQGGALTEVALGVAQRRQGEVQFLTVVAAFAQGRARLDEQNLPVGVLTAVHGRPELVGEQPEGSVVTRHQSEGRRGGYCEV